MVSQLTFAELTTITLGVALMVGFGIMFYIIWKIGRD